MEGTKAGTLLGGRVTYAQAADGHRTGIEPVLLAAFVPARAGETVIEGGTGAGAGLLCLATRVPDVSGIGIETDAKLAALAGANFAANGFDRCVALTVTLPAMPEGMAEHAFANPPWHDPDGTKPADPGRRLARHRAAGTIGVWARALGSRVARGGSLSMIVPAGLFGETTAAMGMAGFGGIALLPLWPRAGDGAKLVMLQGRRGSRAPDRVLAGLALHEADGRFTAAAERVLREGAALGV
jgi:tRNA1(Val) A37 N6-methylase TrmN6